MQMGMGLFLSAAGIGAQPPITVVSSTSTSGATGVLSNLVSGDDVFMFTRRASATPTGFPSGNPQGFTQVASSIGSATSSRAYHVKVTSGMLTDGAFSTGAFTNAPARVFCIGLRNVNSITAGAATSLSATTVTRPYSALSGLNARGFIVGFVYLSSGSPPVPSGATFPPNGDQSTSGRMYIGSGATWDPADAANGSDLDWLELVVGAI